ncbi:MAG: reverse transcriptase (RNA-dependent DNA polymerase)-domain-containing protein, partial [Olpidium bornovanus]
ATPVDDDDDNEDFHEAQEEATTTTATLRRSQRERRPLSAWSTTFRKSEEYQRAAWRSLLLWDAEAVQNDDAAQISFALCFAGSEGTEPRNYDEAQKSPVWREAIDWELAAHAAHGTWDPKAVPLPAGRFAISCKWIFKAQRHADGSFKKYKARLVARGFTQLTGVDFTETFAPVMRLATLRVCLALTVEKRLVMSGADVATAYLNSDLEEELYLAAPPGTTVPDRHALRLRGPIYGLTQAVRAWVARWERALAKQKFQRLRSDPGAFVDEERLTWVLTWVDDLDDADYRSKNFARGRDRLQEIEKAFSVEFRINAGPLSSLLGLRVRTDDDSVPTSISINQTAYLLATNNSARVDTKRYKELVGSLLFVAMGTRPDIAFIVGYIRRHQSDPRQADWDASLRVLQYLRITMDWALTFKNTEVEYIAFAEGCKEALWLRQLLVELGEKAISIGVTDDSRGAQALAQNPVHHQRSKHIDVRWHFVRNVIAQKQVTIVDGRSADMVADVLTKILDKGRHEKHARGMDFDSSRCARCGGALAVNC